MKMPKIWVDGTTLNGEKKEDGLTCNTLTNIELKPIVFISDGVWARDGLNKLVKIKPTEA